MAAHDPALPRWLFAVCALIFAMVIVGGVTRLTHSGLSIVEWRPVTGAIPPITATEWQQEFAKYQGTPEFLKVNRNTTLAGFQQIYWMEYAHRLLGRIIGLAFVVPFVWFLVRRRIPPPLIPRLVIAFALGAAQGALGWYMVASGLVDDPRVSVYRLTAHLGLAVAIYGILLWTALLLVRPSPPGIEAPARIRDMATGIVAAVFVMILSGGLVAGTRAGFTFNDFPLMHGRFIPEGAFALEPAWRNAFENVALVQLDHRLLAYALFLAVPAFWLALRRAVVPWPARAATHWLLVALAVQLSLGITTLVYVVPVPLAALHQAGALVVFSIAVWLRFTLKPRRHRGL